MRTIVALLLLSLAACNPESSPEGRSKLRDQALEVRINDLEQQNNAMRDSIASLSAQIKQLKR